MSLFKLIIILSTFGSVSLVTPYNTPSIDSLRIIEKVYLHTDRNCYYQGDDIWFKAYLINAFDRSLSNLSRNLHVELISPSSEIITGHLIRMENGLGNGDFKLPGNLISGTYRIRAYTNYMRNFSDQLFFNKEFVVINPNDSVNKIQGESTYVNGRIDLAFFPEGGSLVDNIPSVVAFKAVDATGNGCHVSGDIFSSAGDRVTSFSSSHLGMGSFILRPFPGLSYYAVAKDSNGILIKTELPESFPSGVTLGATVSHDNELIITTRTNLQTFPLIRDRDLLLSISARRVLLKTVRFKIKTYTNSLTLPVDDLPDGIVMLTLTTPDDLPVSERLIFIQKPLDFNLTIETGKPVYRQRDSVAIKISASASDTEQVALISTSVAGKDFTDNSTQNPSTISSWFLLESDIRGTVEEPAGYFDKANPNRLHDLDLLLLTQGWRDFKWKYDSVRYYPPEAGFTISGRLRKLNSDKPLETPKVNIGIFENAGSLMTTVQVDSTGRFCLDSIDLTGEARLLVSSFNRKGNPQGWLLLDSIKYIPPEVSVSLPRLKIIPGENITSFKQEYEIKESILKKYKLSDTISLGEVSVVARKQVGFQTQKVENVRILYNRPDKSVIVTKRFSGYSNVFEVLRGRVPGVRVYGDAINIRGSFSVQAGTHPLILIDGMDVSSGRKEPYAALRFLPLDYVDRIDVLKSAGETGAYGARGTNGVISVITKTGDVISQDQTTMHSVNKKISGYYEARVFYSPKHLSSAASSSAPDFRSTLFWEPDIRLKPGTNRYLKYFNADKSTLVKITAEGITSTGIPITATAEYEVR